MTDDPTLDDSRMSIGQHLEELRWHVLKAVGYVAIAFTVAFYLQAPLLKIAQWPYQRAAQNVINERLVPEVDKELREALLEITGGYAELDQGLNKAAKDELYLLESLKPGQLTTDLAALRKEQEDLGKQVHELQDRQAELRDREKPVTLAEIDTLRQEREALIEAQAALDAKIKACVGPFKDRMARLPRLELTQIRPQEAFLSALKLSLVVALFFASPFVARELWSFVSKGLYYHEKKYVRWFAPLTVFAFAVGTMFGYFVLIPFGVEFLIGYLPDVSGSISFGEYLKLFTLLTVLVGAIFELPLVMVFLTLIGVGNATLYKKYFKFWFMAAFVIGAVLTPPDPVTQVLMAVPLVGLFWVGVFASALIGERKREGGEDDEGGDGGDPAPQPPSTPPPAIATAAPAAAAASTPATEAAAPPAPPVAEVPVLEPPQGTKPREAVSLSAPVGSADAETEAEAEAEAETETEAETEAETEDEDETEAGAETEADTEDEFQGEPFEDEAAQPDPVPTVTQGTQTHYALSPEEVAAYEAAKQSAYAGDPAEDDDDLEELGEALEGDEPAEAGDDAAATDDGDSPPGDEETRQPSAGDPPA